jgi:predicted secreted protein
MGYATGWGGQAHLHNGTTLTELIGVTSVAMPEDTVDEIDVTTLKAAGRRKEFISGLIDGGTIEIEMNFVPNSATDILCRAAKDAGDSRAWKIVVPDDDGTPLRKYEGSGFVKGYKINTLSPNEAMTATLMIRTNGAVTEAAA